MDQAALEKIKTTTSEGLSEALGEILGAAAEDLRDTARMVVEAGLQAALDGVPDAAEVMEDQLKALLNVQAIRANQEAWKLAGKITSLILTTVADAVLAAL